MSKPQIERFTEYLKVFQEPSHILTMFSLFQQYEQRLQTIIIIVYAVTVVRRRLCVFDAVGAYDIEYFAMPIIF